MTGSFQTNSSGARIIISPQLTDNNLVIQGYDSSNNCKVRIGVYSGGGGYGFVGVYTNAANSSVSNNYYTVMKENSFTINYKASSGSTLFYGDLRIDSGRFSIYSNNWQTEANARSGETYRDNNNYLRVKA